MSCFGGDDDSVGRLENAEAVEILVGKDRRVERRSRPSGSFAALRMTAETCNGNFNWNCNGNDGGGMVAIWMVREIG
jgi:hypothetical protein